MKSKTFEEYLLSIQAKCKVMQLLTEEQKAAILEDLKFIENEMTDIQEYAKNWWQLDAPEIPDFNKSEELQFQEELEAGIYV